MLVFLHPRVSSGVAGCPVASPCLWGKLENISYSNVSKQVVMSFCVAGVALSDIPNLLCIVSKMSKLEEVSHEMLVFLHPRVSSRVSGFPVASPCLWGKPQNLSFSNVSTQVVMSFCVAGVALCDIPTCLRTCRKYRNWRKSRTKCWFFCTLFDFEIHHDHTLVLGSESNCRLHTFPSEGVLVWATLHRYPTN